ncbi:mycofactocin biosynthesis chaperone MftB [Gryllotalpicola kribbensis]|uniref:Mycofactocin biosynthesis chaperone MftB n=1 Tax=Gryllotalpicola kribbensis TaxID=993084 RepID=A0ABP8ASZ5_9MICO
MSTESRPPLDLSRAWRLHPQVSVRPEPFGALLYHFGTRKLSFLKDPRLLAVVRSLDEQPSARAACHDAGVTDAELPTFRRALETLRVAQMLVEQDSSEQDSSEVAA